ncbi:unnamed protein product [Somion occarium]|uniref:Protein Zds1 C-terminal domain-containing protein n=1 Tax=Somion occarium TaxID=3059160 RepID=A0ABP1E5U7_9APHY
MQPSEFEIQREVETLRDIRRRSTAQGGPGALLIDPDLPGASSQGTSAAYWSATSDDASSSSTHEDNSDGDSVVSEDDPAHLFWVPARLHPEIAPAEFRAFLKEHARAPADGSLSRSSSVSSTGLGRKKSMLSRQYKPSANDGIEDEQIVPIRRNRSSVYSHPGPQLTISDLQKLEELAEEASQSDDPTKLRTMLRRSLSLNLAPTALEHMEDTDLGDEADSPIIVPRPGQILRRAARTKIRKPGQTGEGPHRFTTRSRRGSTRTASHEGYIPSDRSSSDHGDGESTPRLSGDSDLGEVPGTSRPESYSEESSIYDSYVREESEEPEQSPPVLVNTPDFTTEFAPVQFEPILSSQPQPPEPSEPQATSPPPILHHPQPQRLVSSTVADAEPVRSPSPESTSSQAEMPASPRPTLSEVPGYLPPTSPSPSESSRREKDKKGLFGKWGGDKGGKKVGKESREKDSGFFGSLFGGKKKQEDPTPPIGGLGHAGREAAAALLGASKSSKNHTPSPSPQPIQGYARYPIHVERAIYRLSHIKLANPRRPLYEQVLISNLMFWYLGVINKTTPASPGQVNTPNSAEAQTNNAEKEQAEREKKEREERERAEKERAEKERAEKKDSSRRGSLTKTPAAGTPGSRRAEMPVRGPQYDMQHRAMEQEYGYGQPGAPSTGRTTSAPPISAGLQPRSSGSQPHPYQPSSQQGYSSAQVVQPQPQVPHGRHHNGMANPSSQHPMTSMGAPQLPPGAMPPVNVEAGGWMSPPPGSSSIRGHTSPSPPPRGTSPPSAGLPSNPGPRRAKSPPVRYSPAQEKQPHSGGGRTPGRSLSATAAAPMPSIPQVNGIRKGNSVHAVPHRTASEEEDVPLGLYHQRRK